MSERLKLVVFDCDGTLIDSQHMIVAAMSHAFTKHEIEPLPREQVLSIVGLSLDEAIATLVPHVDLPKRSELTLAYKDAFFELRQRADLVEPMFEGARAALDGLYAFDHVLMGIATGKSQRGLRHILETHGLNRYFMTLQTADDAPSKPHPEMLRRAIREAGVEPADTVLVGDTTYDMEMARAAGAYALGVDWGYHETSALKRAGAGRVLTHFDELLPALDRLWAAETPTG